MSYRDNVEQAAVALKRGEDANWELARLTFENTYAAGDIVSQEDRVSMEQWCADIRDTSGRRFSLGQGSRYKSIWRKHGGLPLSGRPQWIDALDEYSGTTGTPMDTRFTKQNGERVLEHGTPEIKREVFQQLARDPDVIEEAANIGSPTSRAVTEISQRREIVQAEQRERAIQSDPVARTIDRQGAALDIEAQCLRFERDCTRFAREISETLTRTGEANEQHLFWVRGTVERARSVLSQLETYMETGQTDIDAFLQDVLGAR